jgi:hypothetical protein
MNVNITVLRNIGALQWSTRTDVSEEPAASICTMMEETIRFSEMLEPTQCTTTHKKYIFIERISLTRTPYFLKEILQVTI